MIKYIKNKTIFKFIFILILNVFLFVFYTHAGAWVQDIYGWRYVENNHYLTNTSCWIAESSNPNVSYYYYFDANGYMLANTISPDGRLIDINGRRLLNGVEETSSAYIVSPNIPYSNNNSNVIIPTAIPKTNNNDNGISPSENYDIPTSVNRSRFNKNIIDSYCERITNVTSKKSKKKYANAVELRADGAYATVYANGHNNIKGSVFVNDTNSSYSYNLRIYIDDSLYKTLYLSGNGSISNFNINVDDDAEIMFQFEYRNTRGSGHRCYIVNQSLK